ncbi:MAG: nucleoside hydrolase [Dehalococcoidia bacterium]|nr:nucleoside hydrolase [Dehalococcoidia bacterium]
MTGPRILLDCDPGDDDVAAIVVAAHFGELVGITTVSGNVGLELTTRNALVAAQVLGIDVPVHAGAARPLVGEPVHAEHVHGESGLGGATLPRVERQPASRDAVGFIVETARAHESLWLVATGPLTNVALALRTAPDIAGRLQGISLMGGSTSFGNATAAAEFNIYADPEAAAIVFDSGIAMRMCGLNVTHKFLVGGDETARLRELGNATGPFLADVLGYRLAAQQERVPGRRGSPLHDPCAVFAVTHPDVLQFEPRPVEVELAGTKTRGMTVVDERGLRGRDRDANVEVAYRDRQRPRVRAAGGGGGGRTVDARPGSYPRCSMGTYWSWRLPV